MYDDSRRFEGATQLDYEAARLATIPQNAVPAGSAAPLPLASDVANQRPLEERIFAEQVRLLFKSPIPLIVNLVNALVVAIALWSQAPPSAVGGWMIAMTAVVAARLGLLSRFRKRREPYGDAAWATYWAVGAAATGLLWGLTAATVTLIDAPLYHMLVGLTAAGMCAGAVASLSCHLPSFYAFVLPCIGPMSAAFLLNRDAPYGALGLLTIVFAVAIGLLARNSNQSLRETLRLRFQNADLAHDLSVARDIADQASRSNWETLAHLSHELRTPLNAIGGFAQIMREHVFGALGHPKYDEYAKDINDSATHLTSLVEEILLYSRGHTGTLRIDEAVVDLRQEIGHCLDMVGQPAREGGLAMSAELPSDLPLLRADPVKLRQVVLNLLSNAIKFTARGGQVTVSAGRERDDAIFIAVADTGIGMDPADLPRVMKPYVQLDSAVTRPRQHGLGLGLPIVKNLVELHGGTLAIESALGVGTKATVRFPPDRTVSESVSARL